MTALESMFSEDSHAYVLGYKSLKARETVHKLEVFSFFSYGIIAFFSDDACFPRGLNDTAATTHHVMTVECQTYFSSR